MATETDFLEFASDFHEELASRSEFQDRAEFQVNTLTQMMIERLEDAGELEEGSVCYFKARGMEVSGYGFSEDDECLDLFVTLYTGDVPPGNVRKDQVETHLRRLAV